MLNHVVWGRIDHLIMPRKERVGRRDRGWRGEEEDTGIKDKDKDIFSESSATLAPNLQHMHPWGTFQIQTIIIRLVVSCFVVLGVESKAWFYLCVEGKHHQGQALLLLYY